MSFSLSGDTITQSGTDTDMSGLTGIGSVQTFSTGGDTVMYIIPYKLDITGTMTIKPHERLHFNRATTFFAQEIKMQSGAVWNWGEQITENGETKDAETLPITFANLVRDDFINNTDTVVYTFGGTLNWRNVTMKGAGHHFYENTTLNWTNVTIDREELSLLNDIQWRPNGGSTLNIDGFRLIRGKVFLNAANTLSQFRAFSPIHCDRGFSARNNAGSTSVVGNSGSVTATAGFFELEDFQPIGNTTDVGVWTVPYIRMINPEPGSNIGAGGWIDGHSLSDGWIDVFSDIRLNILDTQSNPIQDAKTYLEDNNTGFGGSIWANTEVYDDQSNASGEIDFRVMLGYVQIVNGNTPTMLKRSATQTDDLFTWPIISYLHNLNAANNFNLAGIGRKEANVFLIEDTLITQTTKATVDAYTFINNSNEFYDRAKAFLYDNFTGETSLLVTRSGETIDAGSYNIVVNSAAGAAFAFDGSTITIRANTFTGNLTTTGTVTVSGSSVVLGLITDTNGTRSNNTLTLTGLETGSVVHLFNSDLLPTDGAYQLDSQTIVTGTYTYQYEIINGADLNVTYRIHNLNFAVIEQDLTLNAANVSLPISQQADRAYENN